MTRSNLIVGRAAIVVLAVAGAGLMTACSDRGTNEGASTSTQRHTVGGSTEPSPTTAPAWTAAKAERHARGLMLVVDGRRPKLDPTTLVCWGVGVSERRGNGQVWHRFHCIAPTFRGPRAGPDVLFDVQPTGTRSLKVLDARFSSY